MEKYFAYFILFATIAGNFCVQPHSVEANTPQTIKETHPEKRSIGLSALSDCDGPVGVVGLHGGIHSGVAVHDDFSLGLHGGAYAPAFSGGYLQSHGILSHGSVGHVGTLGAVVGASPVISTGYAQHAPIYASSVVAHAPTAIALAPSVTKVVSHPVPVPVPVDRPYPVVKPVAVPVPVDRPVVVPKPVAVPHPVPYPVHHVVTKKVTVPYPVVVPSPSVSYSGPEIVGHGLYSHGLYGSSIGSSYGSSLGSSIGSSYGSSYGSLIGSSIGSSYGSSLGSSIGSYGSYGSSSSYASPWYPSSSHGIKVISPSYKSYYGGHYGGSGGYHGGISLSIGSKYGWPLKFGSKYGHWKK